MNPDGLDRELRAFIRRASPPETFTHLAAALRERFGLDLTASQASHLWRTLRSPRPGKRSDFERNAKLMAFIADRADLMTTEALRSKIAQAFGSRSTPSKSQLFRLVQKARLEAESSFKRSQTARPSA